QRPLAPRFEAGRSRARKIGSARAIVPCHRRNRCIDELSGDRSMSTNPPWPDLPLSEWSETCETLHRWTQVVGKVRMALTPLVNHWWNVTLYVTSRGLTTSPIAYGTRTFEIVFDFVDHRLLIETSDGAAERVALAATPVAEFSAGVMAEAYSHEVSSCGFWPGNGGYGRAAFYVYAYPEPPGYGDAPLTTPEAFYDKGLGQFILPYDAVRQSRDPDALLLGFLQETYEAAATRANWDRQALE